MAYRSLELTLISAKDLRDVNLISKMDVYAVASIAGDLRTQQRTPADRDGGKNPSWNATLRFSVPGDPSACSRLIIHILLRSERALGDRDIGEVHIPLKELLEGSKEDGSKFLSYQVRKPGSGKAKGVLNISCKFVDLPANLPANNIEAKPVTEPVMAYPAAGASGSGYPPAYQPPAYQQGGYGAPPPQGYGGYGAPPPQGYGGYGAPPAVGYGGYGAPPAGGYGGYGAPPAGGYGYGAVPARKNKNNLGLGIGAGLLGGAVGGMLIGDMISDAGAYDAGYDAGFDDGFGF